MSVSAEIIRQPDGKYVDVNFKYPDAKTKYYRVPAEKADSFASAYTSQDKKISLITNTSFAVAILGGVALTNIFMPKSAEKVTRYIAGTLGGVLGACAGIYVSSDYINKSQERILKQHGAKEVYYEA